MSDTSVIYAYLRGQLAAAHDAIRAIAAANRKGDPTAAIREAETLLDDAAVKNTAPKKDDLDDILG